MNRRPPKPEAARPRDRGRLHRTIAIRIVGIGLIIALAIWANIYASRHDLVQDLARRFGYAGILVAAGVSGFNLIVPIPIVAFFPFFLQVGFDRVATLVTIALGMTLGDLLGYLIGRTTRDIMAPRVAGTLARLERLRERHRHLPFVVMFLYASFVPLPNELLVIPLAFLRYPLAGIFVAIFFGNAVFNGLAAFGVVRLFDLM